MPVIKAFITVFGGLEVLYVMKLAIASGSIFYMVLAFWFLVASGILGWYALSYPVDENTTTK